MRDTREFDERFEMGGAREEVEELRAAQAVGTAAQQAGKVAGKRGRVAGDAEDARRTAGSQSEANVR